jgi:hypothetical protein
MTQATTLERQTADKSSLAIATDDIALRRVIAARDEESDDWRYDPDRIETYYCF